jgi:hypothetical protein
MWQPPSLQVKWGSYFRPDAEDEAKQVDSTIKAKDGGLLTLRKAVEKVAPIYDIENVDAYLEELEGENAVAEEKELAKTEATAAIGAKFAPAPKPPAPKKPKAPKK